MEEAVNFILDFLTGLQFVSLSIVTGAVLWGLLSRSMVRKGDVSSVSFTRSCTNFLLMGAGAFVAFQLINLALSALVLHMAFNRPVIPAFFQTIQFQAGFIRVLLAGGLLVVGYLTGLRRESDGPWITGAGLLLLLIVTGGWVTHAAGRLDSRLLLATLTVLHQLAAYVWVGGITFLVYHHYFGENQRNPSTIWPYLARFSWIAAGTVVLLLSTALPLAARYIGSWQGLLGTGYGTLVLAKCTLLGGALGFAALNHRAVRRWKAGNGFVQTGSCAPNLEAETWLLLIILFTAAALASQPPAIDIPNKQATWAEMVETFSPKWPRLSSPAHDQVTRRESGPPGHVSADHTLTENSWSEFNHNVSGIVLVLVGCLALLDWSMRASWTRHWPLGFAALAIFLFFRNDPNEWPLGSNSFWAGFREADVIQHRLATLLAVLIGFVEWRARAVSGRNRSGVLYAFPCMAAIGSILLLSHSHSAFELKAEFLMQVSHTGMGVLAAFIACGRWLELRSSGIMGRLSGLIVILSLVLVGVLLAFYRESVA